MCKIYITAGSRIQFSIIVGGDNDWKVAAVVQDANELEEQTK